MATVRLLPSGTYQLRAYGIDTDNLSKCKQFQKTWTPPQGMSAKRAEKEAARLAAIFEGEVRGGVSLKGDCTLADFYKWWYDAYAVPNLAPATVVGYEYLWSRVNEQLGSLKLKDVDAAKIQAFFGWLQSTAKSKVTGKDENSKEKGQPLSKNTIRLHRMLLSSMFREAVKKGFVDFNPCTGQRVTLPPLDAKKAYSCTDEDVVRLTAALEDEPIIFRAMVSLFLNAGMRKSELHGLRWNDFNPATGMLSINGQLQYLEHKGLTFCETKSETGMRTFKLPASTRALLLEWQAEQSKWRDKIGTAEWGTGYGRKDGTINGVAPNTAWMFTDEYGNPRRPDSFLKRFKRFLSRAGFMTEQVEAIHIHTLRHTNASIMIAKGVDYATAAARLGDSQQTVMKYYAHARQEADDKAAAMLEEAFS